MIVEIDATAYHTDARKRAMADRVLADLELPATNVVRIIWCDESTVIVESLVRWSPAHIAPVVIRASCDVIRLGIRKRYRIGTRAHTAKRNTQTMGT